jgi:hypothetical protein
MSIIRKSLTVRLLHRPYNGEAADNASVFTAFATNCDAQLHAAQTRRQLLTPTTVTREFSPLDDPLVIQHPPDELTLLSVAAPAGCSPRSTRSTRSSTPSRPIGSETRRCLSPNSFPIEKMSGSPAPAMLGSSSSHIVANALATRIEDACKATEFWRS